MAPSNHDSGRWEGEVTARLDTLGKETDGLRAKFHELSSICQAIPHMQEQVGEIHRSLVGNNGDPGLKTRVDRLEQARATQIKWSIAIATTAIGALLTNAKDFIFGGKP